MIVWGINSLNHGSSLAVFESNKLISNEFSIHDYLDQDILSRAIEKGYPEKIYWYERPWLKKCRQLRAGQWNRVFDFSVLPSKYINKLGFDDVPVVYTAHHASHASAGYYTSPFDQCAVVVLDAIGEFECATIWHGKNGRLEKLWSKSYPNSLGLFYSAFTDLLGFTPILEEFKLQQLSQQGDPLKYYTKVKNYFDGVISLKKNLHRGVQDWPYEITERSRSDIAAAVQMVFEEQISSVMQTAKALVNSEKLVYMGGCAMNSRANELYVEPKFKYIWSLPQPGDPSSSIGAVLYHTREKQNDYDFGLAKHIKISV
jgi:carbamoyltransferase